MCAVSTVVPTSDPGAAYGAGSIELVDRQVLDPALDEPTDDNEATRAIWSRIRQDPRLDSASWELMAAGQARCDDGYLYLTLVLRDTGEPGWAAGVQRVTAGDGPTDLAGITTDGSTVAVRSEATDLVPGTTVEDIYTYDVATQALTATGVEPTDDFGGGAVATADGSTVFYADSGVDDETGPGSFIGALDLPTGTTSMRTPLTSTPRDVLSTSADGSVLAVQEYGAGGSYLYLSVVGQGLTGVGDLDSFTYAVSVSDDGAHVARVGNEASIFERATASTTSVRSDCISDNPSASGTSLSADGGFLAFSCLDLAGDGDNLEDVFVWDRSAGRSTWVTSDLDGRRSIGAPSVSDDGRFVAFAYERPTSPSGGATYLWDRTTGRSMLIATVAATEVALSGDGGTVAFTAVAPDQTDPSIADLYVWDNPAGDRLR